jgi:hypothetical protein
MELSEVKSIIHNKYKSKSTRQQYENAVESSMKALNTTNVYDVYNNIDTLYNKNKGKSPKYLAALFSHLKCIMDNMSADQTNNINTEAAQHLTKYGTLGFYKTPSPPSISEEEEEDDVDRDKNYRFILEHKLKEMSAQNNEFKANIKAYMDLVNHEIALLRDLVMQLIVSGNREQALANIASMALGKINDSMQDQKEELLK